MKYAVWTQWDDVRVPDGIRRFSSENLPLESSDLSEITFYVPTYMGGKNALEFVHDMPNLKILQMLNAGYDDALPYLRPEITLCNGRGIHDASTAELAVGMTIASLRGFPAFVRDQDRGEWNHSQYRSINDRKVGIVGFGSIGKMIARNLSGFNVDVVGFSRSGADGSLPMERFDEQLPSLDVVILILPLTQDSKGLFDARRLSLLKDGALLVNVARGPIIDTDALIVELNSGRITAALDVTDPEPLPKEHPLWSAKGVFIAPHVGGNTSAFEPRARRLIESQLSKLASGIRLENIVVEAQA